MAITDSFENVAYDELLKLNLSHNMPKRIEASLSTSFEMLEGLHYMVKEALAGYKYQNVYGSTPDFRESNYKFIIMYTNTISERLEWLLKETNEFTEK